MHPRVLVDGFEIAKRATLLFLEKFKTPVVMGDEPDKEILKMVARTALRTKVFFTYYISELHLYVFILFLRVRFLFVHIQLYEALADQLTDIIVNAVSALIQHEFLSRLMIRGS